jgi:1,4-dihydroxy-2-naphthoate octaprenyltransferase
MSVKLLFFETRPQFLLLSPILSFLGMAIALYGGNFHTFHFILAMVGLILLHTSVNTLNDYSDYKTGIDIKARRTPFSGGSGFLPAGALTPRAVFWLGFGSFLLAIPIGVYFVATRGWVLLPLFVVGAILVLWYTSHITRIGMASGEIAAGLGLGTLPVFGTYFILGGQFDWAALYASVPSGFLVFNLLLLNEFPDTEADKTGKRRTLPIMLGNKPAAIIYSSLVVMTYLWVVVGVVLRLMPPWTLLALLTLPLGMKAIKGSLTFPADPSDKSYEELVPAQGANVMIVLLIQLLIGVGYLIAYFTR